MQVMQRNSSVITFNVEDIEAVLEMNRFLEKENKDLKHEVARLKSQISALKAHDLEAKSTLWKKIECPGNGNKDGSQKKEPLQISDHSPASELPIKKALSPSVQSVPGNATAAPPKIIHKEDMRPNGPPPPPPPLPSKMLISTKLAVTRMPEVIEFYRYLNKKNVKKEKRASVAGAPGETNPRNMIGEIENRSTYLSAVKSDVEMQREFIMFLIQKVETATFKEISAVEAFMIWLDGELSCLVDERAVLKHFPQWPERKTDAIREATGSYRDLKNLKSDILSHEVDPKQPLPETLGRIQALQDRLERVISNVERMRDGACKKYKEMQMPWDWMLDTGLLGQVKLSSLKLAKQYMRKTIEEIQSSRCSDVDDIIHQCARFAYRVHQFASGFDLETKRIFEGLRRIHNTSNSLQPI